jgi:hypothetical protein
MRDADYFKLLEYADSQIQSLDDQTSVADSQSSSRRSSRPSSRASMRLDNQERERAQHLGISETAFSQGYFDK